jgi:hypothetical protein
MSHCNCFQEFLRILLASYVLLCVITLTSSNDATDIEGHLSQNQTALEIPNVTLGDRHSRSPQKPTSANTATIKQDAKTHKPQRSGDSVQSSSSEARLAAKSPLVLKLLQEQEQADISNQLVYSHAHQLHPRTEDKSLYFQQALQENAAGVPRYAELETETLAHKATGVCVEGCFDRSSSSNFYPSLRPQDIRSGDQISVF